MVDVTQFGIYRLILFLFIGISFGSKAQTSEDFLDYFPGYVLTEERDSIHGFIRNFKSDKRYINYKMVVMVDESYKRVNLPNDLRLFNKGNAIFIPNPYADEIEGAPKYMELIEDGKAQLFQVIQKNFKKNKDILHFLLEKDGKVFLLREDTYDERLIEILGPGVQSDKKLKYNGIPIVVKEYNEYWASESTPKYQSYKTVLKADSSLYIPPAFEIITDVSDKLRATGEIKALYDGALIVRLKTNKRKLEAYRNAGYEEDAKALEAKLAVTNRDIIAAFQSNFNFCPVYFIYADDYGNILNGARSGYFLNEQLEVDSSIVLDVPNYFFCDRGAAYATVLEDSNDGNTKTVSSTPMLQDAFVIKNKDLEQLVDPFPFAVSIRLNDFEKSATKLNNALTDFFSKK